jgi:hypothetical protein
MSDHARPTPPMPLSPRSVELLLDLVEIKLAAMDMEDRDVRTIWHLKKCRDELKLIENAGRRPGSRPHYAAA